MTETHEPSPRGHEFTEGLYGWITHTELTSADPDATRGWCEAVLGWKFMPSFQTPDGDYHLFAYSEQGGGGIRGLAEGQKPGSTPFVHVANTDASHAKAIDAGATEVMAPQTVMEGVRLAIVAAPGGVVIGFSGPSS